MCKSRSGRREAGKRRDAAHEHLRSPAEDSIAIPNPAAIADVAFEELAIRVRSTRPFRGVDCCDEHARHAIDLVFVDDTGHRRNLLAERGPDRVAYDGHRGAEREETFEADG